MVLHPRPPILSIKCQPPSNPLTHISALPYKFSPDITRDWWFTMVIHTAGTRASRNCSFLLLVVLWNIASVCVLCVCVLIPRYSSYKLTSIHYWWCAHVMSVQMCVSHIVCLYNYTRLIANLRSNNAWSYNHQEYLRKHHLQYTKVLRHSRCDEQTSNE